MSSLSFEMVQRFEGSTNVKKSVQIHNNVHDLVISWLDEGFDKDDILEYLENEFFDSMLGNIEMCINEMEEEEKRKAEKVSKMLEIEKLAKEIGIKVKFEL